MKCDNAIELDRSCSGKAHYSRPGTGPGCENMDPECILTILRVLSTIYSLRSADAKSGNVV